MDDDRPTALDLPPVDPLPEATRKYFEVCEEKLGMVPNVLRAYAFDTTKLDAFTAMYNDLMLGDSGLSKLEREMIAVVVSAVNRCYYCLTAHGAAVRQLSGDPKLGEMLVMNWRVADLDARQTAMLTFAEKATKASAEITELDRMRAFCVAIAAAITVIIASQLGLPVSSTHIAIGGVFGVGFLREHLKSTYRRKIDEIEAHHAGADREEVERLLREFDEASFREKGVILKDLKKRNGGASPISKTERKSLKKLYRKDLVKRSALFRIVAAWLITVPLAALLAAMLFFMIRGMLLP